MVLQGVHYSAARPRENHHPVQIRGEAMTKLQIQIVAGLVVLALLLGVGAILLTEAQNATPAPERMQSEGCTSPCWRGQQPGITRQSFQATMQSFGVTDLFDDGPRYCGRSEQIGIACITEPTGDPNTPSESVVWAAPEAGAQARLVDAIAAYGEPEQAKICWNVNTWHAALLFANHTVLLALGGDLLDGETMAYAPGQVVERVTFYTADSFPKSEWEGIPVWTGYGTPNENQTACKL